MFNTLHNTFLRAVETLQLKFPGKAISSSTNYGNSIVSEYLNSKKEASDAFVQKFCEAYQFDFSAMQNGEIIKKISPALSSSQAVVESATIKMLCEQVAQVIAKMSNKDISEVNKEMSERTMTIIVGMMSAKG